VISKELITSIYNKRTEIHYNEFYIKDRDNKIIHLELKGKLKCPILNIGISSLVCSKLMDKQGWPRGVDSSACSKCSCFISLSIQKFQERKKKDNGPDNSTSRTVEQKS
jgi:hypothetical protein